MKRFLLKFCLAVALAAMIAVGLLLWLSPDPNYQLQEWIACGRYHRHDTLIAEISKKHNIDPLLIKAVTWRESEFHTNKTGRSGERGLMQVGESAALDWAKANNVENFVYTDLFDARTNLDVGTWYLKRALERWKDRDKPIPFALSEYNAGRKRTQRWAGNTSNSSEQMLSASDIASTKKYIEGVLHRYHYYQQRGW